MFSTRRLVPVIAAFTLTLVSCGGSSGGDASSDASDPSVPAADSSTVDGAADVASSEPQVVVSDTIPQDPAEAPTTGAPGAGTEAPSGSDPAASGQVVTASLVEWAVEAPSSYDAGDITFVASNNGNFPHEFVVIQAEGYESLPLEEGGGVIEEELPTGAIVGRTDRIGGGSSEELTVTLAAGNYVLLCNLGGGSNSHAGQGQRLDITVN